MFLRNQFLHNLFKYFFFFVNFYIFLEKNKPVTNKKRNTVEVTKKFNFFFKLKNTFIFLKKKKSFKKKVVNSKRSFLNIYLQRSLLENIAGSYFILVKFLKKNQSCGGVIKSCLGSFFYIKIVHGFFLSDTFFIKNISSKFYFNSQLNNFIFVFLIEIHKPFSNLFFYFNNKKKAICSSNGVFGFISIIFYDLQSIVIILPSTKKVVINFFYKCFVGRQTNVFKKRELIGNAGLNRTMGKKSTVRGVAKNPVDHPHGGRTKSVQPEVSPWGWIAKKKH